MHLTVFKSINNKRKAMNSKRAEQRSVEVYQISEHNGQLWFTFMSNLVCPCNMFKDEPVEALKKMRNDFIARENGEE